MPEQQQRLADGLVEVDARQRRPDPVSSHRRGAGGTRGQPALERDAAPVVGEDGVATTSDDGPGAGVDHPAAVPLPPRGGLLVDDEAVRQPRRPAGTGQRAPVHERDRRRHVLVEPPAQREAGDRDVLARGERGVVAAVPPRRGDDGIDGDVVGLGRVVEAQPREKATGSPVSSSR